MSQPRPWPHTVAEQELGKTGVEAPTLHHRATVSEGCRGQAGE